MSACCVRAQLLAGEDADRADGARELADIFCQQARVRVEELFDRLWTNSDDTDRRAARRVLDGRYTWLEDGILDPSIPGPWIAEQAAGPSSVPNLHRTVVRRVDRISPERPSPS
jgi:hypothetical protein